MLQIYSSNQNQVESSPIIKKEENYHLQLYINCLKLFGSTFSLESMFNSGVFIQLLKLKDMVEAAQTENISSEDNEQNSNPILHYHLGRRYGP